MISLPSWYIELSIEDAIKSIEDRIEKRSNQLKKILSIIEGWGEVEEADEHNPPVSPRSDWLKAAIEANEEAARSQNKDEEKIRLTKVACVQLTQELHHEDGHISKADAMKLAKEFAGQIAALKEFLNNMLRTPLAEGIKNLKSRQTPAVQ